MGIAAVHRESDVGVPERTTAAIDYRASIGEFDLGSQRVLHRMGIARTITERTRTQKKIKTAILLLRCISPVDSVFERSTASRLLICEFEVRCRSPGRSRALQVVHWVLLAAEGCLQIRKSSRLKQLCSDETTHESRTSKHEAWNAPPRGTTLQYPALIVLFRKCPCVCHGMVLSISMRSAMMSTDVYKEILVQVSQLHFMVSGKQRSSEEGQYQQLDIVLMLVWKCLSCRDRWSKR